MSQNSFQQMRQNFAKQKRRQQLEQIFRSKRKQNSQKLVENQKETFINLLPNIDTQNYEHHRFTLSEYARSTTYSYQMLPIAFISFEYLLSHPLDSSSWQILTYLSDYEDFQIPQTQDFVQILIQYLNQDPQLISQLLFNISKLHKCSLLCCRLIDASIFYIIEEKVHQIEKSYLNSTQTSKSQDFKGKDSMELQIHNFLFALCCLFSIQPMIEINQMNKICQILNFQNQSNKFLKEIRTQAIFSLIENAVSNLSHQPSVIKLLFDQFQPTIYNSFFIFSEESMIFLDCCIKNKVRLSQRLIKNLITSIKHKSKSKVKINAFKIVQKILDATNEKQQMQVEPNNFQTLQPFIEKKISISFQDFNSMFTSSSSEPKKKVYQEEIQNCMVVYLMLFNQKYEQELKTLFQISQSSGENVKQEIVRLIRSMIGSLIREIENYEPKRLTNKFKEIFEPEKMEEFLCLTVEQDEFFYWTEQCLKSTNVPVVENTLNLLIELALYFRDKSEGIEQDNSKVNISYFVNQIHKFSIYSCFEDLGVSQNPEIRELAEDLLSIIDQVEK